MNFLLHHQIDSSSFFFVCLSCVFSCRLYKGQQYVEVEWTVGPIPFEDGFGREIILRYSSDIHSGDTFFTDVNGREMARRALNKRPTWDLNVTDAIAGNYYPVTAAAFIQDDDVQLAVLTDRGQGEFCLFLIDNTARSVEYNEACATI